MDTTITLPTGRVMKAVNKRTVGAKEERNGKVYLPVRTWTVEGPGPEDETLLMRRDASGVFVLHPENGAKEETDALFPLEPGKKWTKSIGQITISFEVIAIQDITVAGKVYEKCAHIRTTMPSGQVYENYWEAPGIGCVRSEISFPDGTKAVLTLRESKPGKK